MNHLQNVFQRHYSLYRKTFKVSKDQAKAANAIINCRTKVLGGHVNKCSECGYSIIQYNSCRNRNCASCQGVDKAIWVDQRSKDILNAPYFHVVFTMPDLLHQVIYMNQKLLYDLMYKAVAETIQELSRDKKYLGAQVGFLSLLHTWGSDLHYHPHIHTIVLAGGLSEINKWRSTSNNFFIPVKVLSKKFRGKFLYYLKQAYDQDKLNFYTDAIKYKDTKVFQGLIDQCYKVNWYSYSKRTFNGPAAVIKYIGQYTNRIAISDSRIVSTDEKSVTFVVKDYKEKAKKRLLTLSNDEFIRRFLRHVLPSGFVKIRYYGLLANRNKKTKLALCRKLTQSPHYTPEFEGMTKVEVLCLLVGRDVLLCPNCKKKRLEIAFSFGSNASP